MSENKKSTNIANILLLPLFAVVLPVKMLIINPIARLIGSTFGKHDLKILEKYQEQIDELKYFMKYPEALEICEEALKNFDNSYLPNDNSVLTIFIQKVVLHALLSQHTKSEELMIVFEKDLKETEFYTNKILIQYDFGKALLAKHRNQLSEAEKYYKKALKLSDTNEFVDETYFESHLRLAEIYLDMREPKRALENLEYAKLFIDAFKDSDDKEFLANISASMLIVRAETQYQMGQYEDSKNTYNEALRFLEEAEIYDLDYADMLLDYSIILIKNNDSENVEKKLQKVKGYYEKAGLINHQIDYYDAIRLYNSGERVKSVEKLLVIFNNTFPNLILEYHNQLELEIISKIITIYNELGDHSNSLKFLNILNKELFKTINESTKKLTDHERYYFLNSIYEVLLNIYDLLENYSSLPQKHKKSIYTFRLLLKLIESYEELDEVPTVNLITNLPEKKSAIVDIIRIQNSSEFEYFAFIIDQNIEILKLETSLEKENDFYEYYIKSLKRKALDLRSFNNYWGQLQPFLESKKHIYITTEGYYNHINIANLYTVANKYYFETKNIYLFQNYFGVKKESKVEPKDAFIIGNPVFELEYVKRYNKPPEYINAKLNVGLTELPYSEKEGRSISEILINSNYSVAEFYGKNATPFNLSKVKNPKIIHIATHGFNFNSISKAKGIADWENLSGLFLTNSVATLEDEKYCNNNGMLYSSKIKKLKLKGTKLGVLSACNSGSGFLLNTGSTTGLQKAMFSAGVETLIVALWEIEDKIAHEFMFRFYSEWTKEENIDSSFEIAKKEIKTKYTHPFYWAGFKVIHKTL